MNNLHRIFIAINLPDRVKKELASYQDRWPELPAHWTRLENLHITLNFLGNANDQEICEICREVTGVVKRHEVFDLSLNRVVYGPTRDSRRVPPRMVWAVGDKSAALGALQKDLESTLYEFCGGEYRESENYSFAPHVTLARLKQTELHQIDPEEIPEIDEGIREGFLVESIEVMESQLRKGGPVYNILESLNLGGE